MQIMALHGEAACYGLTGDGTGRVGDRDLTDGGRVQYEGAVSAGGTFPNSFVDSNTWAFESRKDKNDNGGRYAFGLSGRNGSTSATFVPSTIDKTAKEVWFRLAVMSSSGAVNWYVKVQVASYAGVSRRANVGFEVNQGLTYVSTFNGTNPVVQDSRVTDIPQDGTWSVFEMAVRVDSVDGYVRVYKNYNYTTPYLEFVGDTTNFQGTPPERIEELFVEAATTNESVAVDDMKCVNVTFTDIGSDLDRWYDNNFPAFDPDGMPTRLMSFYSRADATAATGTITVRTSPLPGGQTITINGKVLTGTLGARTPGADDFSANAGSIDAIAQSIADAINDSANSFVDPNGRYGYTATNDGGGVVTVTVDVLGSLPNSTDITSTYTPATEVDVTAFGGGANGTYLGDATVWATRAFPGAFRPRIYEVYALEDSLCYATSFDGARSGYLAFKNDRIDPDSGFPGDGYFQLALVPDAAGTNTNLTRGGVDTGNNFDQVNDGVGALGEASYVLTTITGVADTYNYGAFPIVDGDIDGIKSVNVYSRVQKVSEAADDLVVEGETSAAWSATSLQDLETAFTNHWVSLTTDPADGSAWTKAKLDALEVGVSFS